MRLTKRIEALETARGIDDLSHLTDEEIEGRLREIAARLAVDGWLDLTAWNEAFARGDWRALERLTEDMKCEILAEG